MASMAITEHTSNTMPSMVSSERRRCNQRLRMPTRIARWSRACVRPHKASTRLALVLVSDIAFNMAVTQTDGAAGAFAHTGIMGDENQGFALGIQFIENFHNLHAGGGIEIAGGFIGQDDERIVDQRAGNGHALLLAAGKFKGFVIDPIRESDARGKFAGAFPAFVFGTILVVERDFDVLHHRKLLDEIVRLENETKPRSTNSGEGVVIHARHILATEQIVAGRGPVKTAEEIEHGGFAAAGRTHDADVITGGDVKGHTAQCLNRVRTHLVGLADVVKLDDGRWHDAWVLSATMQLQDGRSAAFTPLH